MSWILYGIQLSGIIKYWSILVTFLLILPLIIVYIIQEKKNRVRHIQVSYSLPNGTTKISLVKIGFSWTIFFFNSWSLIFRGQFIEFFILFFGSSLFATLSTFSLIGFDISSLSVFQNLINNNVLTILDFNLPIINIIGFIIFMLLEVSLVYYFILYGNKLRLKKLYKRGFNFNLQANDDVEDLYKYIGEFNKINPLEKNQRRTQGSHTYVIPEKEESNLDDPNDWSHLTIQDLKLLLKSEGIAFDYSSSKQELLKICEKYLGVKKENKTKNPYEKMTIAQLMDELDSRGIKYKKDMKKPELRDLIIYNDKKIKK